jgi:hypothetical protein
VGQQVLEEAVIEAVLKHYAPYRGAEGLKRLVELVRHAQGVEIKDLAEARQRVDKERREVEVKIARLLDHMTAGTRDLVEQRLDTLRQARAKLESRREELELLASNQAAVQDQARELWRFVDGLEFTLRHGTNVEKIAVMRRCVEGVSVDTARAQATMTIRAVAGIGDGKILSLLLPPHGF